MKNINPRPPRAGAGRPKGSPNKTTAKLKEAILIAAENAGADMNGKDGIAGYCYFLATTEPKAFAGLLGKVLPMQVAGPDDDEGNPTEIVMRVVRPKH